MSMKILFLFLLQTVLASFCSKEPLDKEKSCFNDQNQDIGDVKLSCGEGGAIPVLLSDSALKTDRSYWYRGDKREPSNIFNDGFKARGNNTSLIEHVHGNESGPIKDSAYISTSILEEAATRYPHDFIGRSYIYLINPQKNGVDVNQALVLEIDAGRMLREDANFYLIDHEMAVPYQIKKEHIKGAWIADSLALSHDLDKIDNLYSREVRRDSFIANPHYVKPFAKTVASLRIAGGALTTLGIYLDTTALWEAYKSGDNGRFFGETARVIGGWTGSIALGTKWGKESSLAAWRFTKNPGLTLASGVVGAVAGSVLGYTGGGLIALKAVEGPSVWTDLYHTLKSMEPDRSNFTENVKSSKSIENDLFAKLDKFWISFKNELREEGSIEAVIRKHLPSDGPGKPDLIGVLKRLDYHSEDESPSLSAQLTAEEMFGSLEQDIKHPHSELLKHANIGSDDTDKPGKIFKNAKVIIDQHQSSENVNRNHELEKAYTQVYELTDRAKNIRASLMTGDSSVLVPARYYADDFRESADIANSWALTLNSLGDPVTGRKLSAIGSALNQASVGAALLSMQQASLLQKFGGFSSWISAGAVFLSLFMSDDDEDGNEGLQMLMNAIVQLGQAIQHVLRNQEQMIELMQVTLMSINDVDSRLRQMHEESQEAFEFIASLELKNACLSLQDDLNNSNAVSMTIEDRRKALATLERWLKQHLFAPVMTKSSSAYTTATLAVEFISKQQQKNLGLNSMGFVMTQLRNYLGETIVPSKFTQLPPLLLFLSVAHVFLQSMLKAEIDSDDACCSLLRKLQDMIDIYTELAEHIQKSETLWSALFAQYDHQRNMVGRAIAAANVPNQAVPLHSLVTNDLKRRNLMDTLDQMEEKRLFLLILYEFAFDGIATETLLNAKIQALESKNQILTKPASTFYLRRGTQAAYYLNNVTDEDIHLALCSGAALNMNYLGGNILNYTGYLMINTHTTRPFAYQWEVDRIHLAMRHSSPNDRLNANMISTYVPATTWPTLNFAMRMCSNLSRYGFGLLLIIAGFDKPWDYETLLNSGWWAESASGLAREYQMFISSTIRKDGVLNRYKLIRAHEYYRLCENGEIQKADTMVQEGVDANCVLWLVALLGKWYIFERLQVEVNLSQTLGKFNFGFANFNRGYTTAEIGYSRFYFSQESLYTPLMVAAEHGRKDVVEGMIREMEAGRDIGITRRIHYGNASAAQLALQEKHFDIAKRLADLGAPLEPNALVVLSSKELLAGPLPLINANMVLLVKSDTLEQGGRVIKHLNQLSSSMKSFADAYKWVLNSKIRRLMEAFQKQENMKRQLEQFDNIIERIELMSFDGFVTEGILSQFKNQSNLSKDYYEKLQAKTKRIAKIYKESYEYEKFVSTISSTFRNHDIKEVRVDESSLKDEFMNKASQIAQDFGINIDKVFELIQSATIHIKSMGDFNDSGIILLGATGTGKSTLLNFISGCLYKKTKKSGKKMRDICSGDEISGTSHLSRAQTRFPVVFNYKNSFSLVDLPGFLDNTENTSIGSISSYDIVSALSMNLISTKFKRISGLIACCTEAQLTAERPPLELQETFRNIGRIIKEDPELSNNVKLFVTKHTDLEPGDVIEGLQQLAIDFSNDEDMCVFLNLFRDEEAVNRILLTDVINDDDRAFYISELEKLKPQETHKFNFRFYSAALIRLQGFVESIVKLRDELVEEISLLETEKESILDYDMNSKLIEHVPQIHNNVADNESIDSLNREQAVLSEIFSHMTGLPDLLQSLELKIMRVNEISSLIGTLKAKESIETQFIMDCCNLGLYEL